jgi:hypothetical protein
MVNCPSCGSVIEIDQRFCDTCGATVGAPAAPPGYAQHALGGLPVTPTSPTPVYGVPAPSNGVGTLPGTPIVLGDGEVLWRQYRAVQLRTRAQGEGTIFVTDTRVVLYARAKGRGTQRPSAMVQQTKLEHITGVTAAVSRRFSLGLLIFTIVVGLIALSLLLEKSFLFGLLLAVIAGFCAWRLAVGAANRGAVGVVIHAGSQGSPISFGRAGHRGAIARLMKLLLPGWLYRFLGVFTADDVLDEGDPGVDSDQLIAELGALIFDLQTRGNLADTHWGVVTSGPALDRTLG